LSPYSGWQKPQPCGTKINGDVTSVPHFPHLIRTNFSAMMSMKMWATGGHWRAVLRAGGFKHFLEFRNTQRRPLTVYD